MVDANDNSTAVVGQRSSSLESCATSGGAVTADVEVLSTSSASTSGGAPSRLNFNCTRGLRPLLVRVRLAKLARFTSPGLVRLGEHGVGESPSAVSMGGSNAASNAGASMSCAAMGPAAPPWRKRQPAEWLRFTGAPTASPGTTPGALSAGCHRIVSRPFASALRPTMMSRTRARVMLMRTMMRMAHVGTS